MKSAVRVERIKAGEALSHWIAAPDASIFTHPSVLSAFTAEVHWWLASEQGQPTCLWPVGLDREGEVVRTEFGYYVGPVWLHAPEPSPRRRLLRSMAVHHALLESLTRAYARVHWSTLPGQHDLRPWQWYHRPGRLLDIRPRQTATLQGLRGSSDAELLGRFSSARRRQFRLAEKGGATVVASPSPERVKDLYMETLAANGAADLARLRFGAVDTLCRLVDAGHGRMVSCGIGSDPTVHAVWLVLAGKGRACEVLGASDARWRALRFNAYGRLHCLIAAREMGATIYDFNGANSPHRALDKHSYRAEAELYFDLSL